MTEEQLTDYLHSAKTLTKDYKKQKMPSTRKVFPYKDKRELDPGEL
jgi:hypothetical protein